MLMLPFLLALPAGDAHAWGKKEKKEEAKGMMMPDLKAVLGDAYDVPPELSTRAVPGAVIRVTERGWQPVMMGCVAGEPDKSDMAESRMQSSLAGGVSVTAAGVGGNASAASSKELAFIEPYILSYGEAVFAPSADCMATLKAVSKRQSLAGVVLVQESLLAKIKGSASQQQDIGGGLPIVGGARIARADLSARDSDVFVVVGVRTVKLLDLPGFAAELSRAVGTGPATHVSPSHTALLTDAVRDSVHQGTLGQASVITPENMATVLGDQGIDLASVSGADAVQTGRQMSAAYVVTGSIVKVDRTLMCKLEVYKTADGVLVSTTTFHGRTVLELVAQVPPVMAMQLRRVREDMSKTRPSRRRSRSTPRIAVLEIRTR